MTKQQIIKLKAALSRGERVYWIPDSRAPLIVTPVFAVDIRREFPGDPADVPEPVVVFPGGATAPLDCCSSSEFFTFNKFYNENEVEP